MLLLPRHHRAVVGAATKRALALLLAIAGLARGDGPPSGYPPGPAPGPACTKIVYCLDGEAYDRDFTNSTGETCEDACGGNCCVDGACSYGGVFSVCADDGDGSCTGEVACYGLGGSGGKVGLISGGSCRGHWACKDTAAEGGTIGDISCGSCRGPYACNRAASDGGVIGDIVNSCRGEYACQLLQAENNETAGDPEDVHSCCNGEGECQAVGCRIDGISSCPTPTPSLPSTCALPRPTCEAPDVYRSKSDDCERALTFEECKDAAKTLEYKWVNRSVPNSGKDIDHMPGGCFVKKNFNNERIVKARFSDNGDPGTRCNTTRTKGKWTKECMCGKYDDIAAFCPPESWCARVLAENVDKPHRVEELMSAEDIQELVEGVNENVDLAGIHYKKDDLLSKEECEALIRYFDDHAQLETTMDPFQKEDVFIEASAIAEVIGTDAFQGILAFLFESVGKAPVSSIALRRSYADGVTVNGMMPWHMHEKIPGFKESTVTVALDGGSVGGNLRFLTRDGVVSAPRQQGRGYAVPYNTLHAVDPYHGTRYSLNVHVNNNLEGSITE